MQMLQIDELLLLVALFALQVLQFSLLLLPLIELAFQLREVASWDLLKPRGISLETKLKAGNFKAYLRRH